MKSELQLGLEGAFKVDLYSGNQFMETTDWFKNFITHTGLSYPSIYPFVDCFRYLSIGYSSGFNVPNSGFTPANPTKHTTGLANPVPFYTTTSGTQKGTYIGWRGYEVGSDGQESPCGTILTEEGPCFFRAWSIPTGDVGITMNENGGSLQIGEFMVSPSSGEDATGKYAFSRITRNLAIPNGWRAIVSYQLKIRLQNTGRSSLNTGSFTTGNADVTNDADLISGWANLSGYYRHVYHGLACLDKRGNSFVPRYGAIMEPSLVNLAQMSFYLSPDNSAFDVNGKYGGPQTVEADAYAADGLMKGLYVHGIPLTYEGPTNFDTMTETEKDTYYNAPITDASKKQSTFPSSTKYPTPFNIRVGDNQAGIKIPSLENYSISNLADLGTDFSYQEFQDSTVQEISYASPGRTGFNPNKANFGQKAVFATRAFKLPADIPTGRRKTQTRRTMFAPVSSLGTNTRFGSLVVAYNTDLTQNYPSKVFLPLIDCLFYNSQGRSLMPHYRQIPSVYFTERGTGVADAYVTLFTQTQGTGTAVQNIQRIWHRQTFQGPYNGSYADGIDRSHPCFTFDVDNPPQGLRFSAATMSGVTVNPATDGDVNWSPGSGRGAVYGLIATSQYWDAPYDVGLIDHNLSALQMPTNSSPIYWPDFSTPNNQIKLSITGIKFYNGGPIVNDNPAASAAQLAASGFCRPTGYVFHMENVGSSGFRLLPLHGTPNNSGINAYLPTTGGAYPGLSLDNGLDLYLAISWNSDCGNAVNCDNAP